MTVTERDQVRRRRGFWIKLARDRLGLTTDAVAVAVGYGGAKPGSVVTRWEKGERAVPSDKFPALARILDIPADWLTDPPRTDLERLEDRLDELVRAASALERADWEREEARAQEGDAAPDDAPRRRSA